jgi:hypothetical protein
MKVKASLPVRNLNLVVPLAHEATAMRTNGNRLLRAALSGAVSLLIGTDLRQGDVDSTMQRSTPRAMPGTRTSTTATRTTTTSATSSGREPSADPDLFEQLVAAYLDCRRNKRNSRSALDFESRLERNLCELHDELIGGHYQPGRSICFVITRPKPREVWAAEFRDRIVHRLLYNRISPRFYARFTADSCACIPGRGTLYEDGATNTAWLGFSIGMRCAERVEKAKAADALAVVREVRQRTSRYERDGMPTPFSSGFDLACEEIAYRLEQAAPAHGDNARYPLAENPEALVLAIGRARSFLITARIQSTKGAMEQMAACALEQLNSISTADLGSLPTAAARDVLAERQRQVSAEGWTPEHDDKYPPGELAKAAACYAIHEPDFTHVPSFWPWGASWWKPTDSRRNLVKAGALILAELERLDRASAPAGTTGAA